MKYVALLRAINVGGNNILPMKALCALFEAAGCANVASYIQSGNVVFELDATAAAKLPVAIEAAIAKRFGFRPPVQLRSATELEHAIASQPFADPAKNYVGFLAVKPTAARLAALPPELGAPDRYVVRDREVYFDFATGAARTKLTVGYFDKALATVMTMRNWNTVLKLREMLR